MSDAAIGDYPFEEPLSRCAGPGTTLTATPAGSCDALVSATRNPPPRTPRDKNQAGLLAAPRAHGGDA